MRRSVLASIWAVLLLIASGGPARAGSADWTHLGSDGGRSHVNRLEQRLGRSTVAGLRLDWRRSIRPDRTFFWESEISPKLVSDSRVFATWSAGESRDDLVALDEATGDRLWVRRFDGYPEPIAAHGGAVFVALRDKVDKGLALSAEDGTKLWSRRRTLPFAADPMVTRLFAVRGSDQDRRIVAIDAATGSTVWTSDLDPRNDGSDLLVSQGLVIAPGRTTPRSIVALRADDGTQAWSATTRGWLSVAAAGRVYAIRWLDVPPVGGALVEAFSLQDGSRLWSHRLPTQAWIRAATARTVFVDRAVCARGCEGDAFGRHRGGIVALDARTGSRRWNVLGNGWGGDPLWQTGAVANGLVFVYRFELGNAAFGALEAAKGRLRWSRSIGGPGVFASLDVVANGAVLGGTYWNGKISGMIVRYALPAAA
jgi:outer membrane protein assembly factor BamB